MKEKIDFNKFLEKHIEDLVSVHDKGYSRSDGRGDLETMHAALCKLNGIIKTLKTVKESLVKQNTN